MKRILPIVLIGIFAIYFYEQRTGRDLFVGSTFARTTNLIDRTTGSNFSSGASVGAVGGFAGGYGAAVGRGPARQRRALGG